MKKLSEIGLSRDNFIEKYSEYFKNDGPAVALTASDRRELVRGVVVELLEHHRRFLRDELDGPGPSRLDEMLDELFRDNGL